MIWVISVLPDPDDDVERPTPLELSCDIALDAPVNSGEGGPEPTPRELDPSDPAFYWHSLVRARGWAQPTLDGSNGGEDPAAWLWRHHRLQEATGVRAVTQDRRDGAAPVNAHPGAYGFGR